MAVPVVALVVFDLAVTTLTPKAPATPGTLKWAVTVMWAVFNELVSEYTASASARTSRACAAVGRNSTSWVAASPDAVDPLHSLPYPPVSSGSADAAFFISAERGLFRGVTYSELTGLGLSAVTPVCPMTSVDRLVRSTPVLLTSTT